MTDGLAPKPLWRTCIASGQSRSNGKSRIRALLVWESLDPTDSRTAVLIDASKATGHLSHGVSSKSGRVAGDFLLFFFFFFLLSFKNELTPEGEASKQSLAVCGRVNLNSSSHERAPEVHL